MKVLSVHEAQTFSLLAAGLLAACFRGGGVMVCWSILLVPAVVCMLMGYCTDIRYSGWHCNMRQLISTVEGVGISFGSQRACTLWNDDRVIVILVASPSHPNLRKLR